MWAWINYVSFMPPCYYEHWIPGDDEGRHFLSPTCPCRPEEIEEGIFTHNSFDGREDYEEGYRKVH